ncbi:unnamed protein product, partial [Vitis vinifera]|uniref:Uncharacterized protein n=1 Tax=Vitis vinifera TaxID=29760 RepID=E0CUM6_VITVI
MKAYSIYYYYLYR